MTEPRYIADVLDELIEGLADTPKRMPVLNREPREQMSGQKWHLIYERDGGRCWMCGTHVPKGFGEVDHVFPRSSFAHADLATADRSDNLRTSCVGCNQTKSNYAPKWAPPRIGVTTSCWECSNQHPDPDADEESYRYWAEDNPTPLMTAAAYCGRCGLTRVPDESWLL